MTDPALFRVGAIGAILAAICCSAPLLLVGLPPASLGACWQVQVGCCFPPLVAGFGLVSVVAGQEPRPVRCRFIRNA